MYSFNFRITSGMELEWVTATIVAIEKIENEVIKVRISVENQNIFKMHGKESKVEVLGQILLNGFGKVYSKNVYKDKANAANPKSEKAGC